MPRRCEWAEKEKISQQYHDTEWGVPLHDDRRLFELLVLEGMQAGLSWLTILKKREHFRRCFDGFDPVRVAMFGEERVRALLADAGIIRNRLKISAAVGNAQSFLKIQRDLGSFDTYIWAFVGGMPITNNWQSTAEIPARTAVSDAMSGDLKSRGFSFVGSTICYSFMQAAGLVNDHLAHCFRKRQISQLAGQGAPAGKRAAVP